MNKCDDSQGRRNFFKQSLLGLIGLKTFQSLHGEEKREDQSKKSNRIARYNTLGRTGFKVSDVAFGNPKVEAIINMAIDAGVNYLDTGETYGQGNSERAIGKVIKNRDRKSIFITTKLPIKKTDSKESILSRARKCLERLNTEYIDCLMIHNATDTEIVGHEGFHSACKQLKSEGRLRFIGITSHGQTWWKNDKQLMFKTMENVLYKGAADGRFDVFMFVYNFLTTETGDRILKACKEKNIGVVAMKINPVHNFHLLKEEINKFRSENKEVPPAYQAALKGFIKLEKSFTEFAESYNIKDPAEIGKAAFRYVAKHPGVHSICCAMPNFEKMEQWLSLSGSRLLSSDQQKLSLYKQSYGRFYCRHACGLCEGSCPKKIPVNTIMRYNHYFDSQYREKEAMLLYSKLPRQWDKGCRDCPGHCEKNCPYQVPIRPLLGLAHQRLTLA
jgi:predicted aldo/keto reductase-like oxidoreductase